MSRKRRIDASGKTVFNCNELCGMAMMRISSILLATLFAVSTSPALADTIVEDVAFGPADPDIGASIFGQMFKSSMGTLNAVSFFVSGTYMPNIVVDSSNPTLSSTLHYSGNASGSFFTVGTIGNFMLTDDARHLVGPAEAFSFTELLPTVDDSHYISTQPAFDYGFLANLALFSRPLDGSWGNPYSDNSLSSGDLQVTYSYTPVPEPSSLAILAAAACLLPFARRRARA